MEGYERMYGSVIFLFIYLLRWTAWSELTAEESSVSAHLEHIDWDARMHSWQKVDTANVICDRPVWTVSSRSFIKPSWQGEAALTASHWAHLLCPLISKWIYTWLVTEIFFLIKIHHHIWQTVQQFELIQVWTRLNWQKQKFALSLATIMWFCLWLLFALMCNPCGLTYSLFSDYTKTKCGMADTFKISLHCINYCVSTCDTYTKTTPRFSYHTLYRHMFNDQVNSSE